MKVKSGFVLSEIAGKHVAVPTEGDLDLNMMITLNETGVFLWEKLQEETTEAQLVQALLAEYDVSEAQAKQSVAAFVSKLKENQLIV